MKQSNEYILIIVHGLVIQKQKLDDKSFCEEKEMSKADQQIDSFSQ